MPQAFTYIDDLPYINNGEPVEAGVANRVVQLLKNNTDYLKGRLDAIVTNEYLAALNRAVRSDTVVGTPVYYLSATSRFEPAQAVTGKSQAVGVVRTKSTATLADIVTSGAISLDITPALATGEVLAAGRYYLSETEEGKLTRTPPTHPTGTPAIQMAILYADGVGRVYVLPSEILQGPTGPMGPVGLTGPTGPAGPAGLQGPQGAPGMMPLKYASLADKVVENTDLEGSLVAPNGWGALPIPANSAIAGRTYRIYASGRITSTALPTLNIRLKLGTVLLVQTGAVALTANPVNGAWYLTASITFRSIGATGTVIGQGFFVYDNQTNNSKVMGMAALTPATVDTTVPISADVTAQWGVANTANSITCTNFTIEALN